MNLDQHIRTVLRARAEGVAAAPVIPQRTLRRVRVRKTLMTGSVAAVVAAVVFGGFTASRSLTNDAAPVPPADKAGPEDETTALLEAFLQARIDGEGAEEYVEFPHQWSTIGGIPLMYGTTTGAPYERFEFERVGGPDVSSGGMFEVRLFAQGGETVVEQLFWVTDEAGRFRLAYQPTSSDIAPTTENGEPVAVPYGFLDGEVTVQAAHPWAEHVALDPALVIDQNLEERFELVGNPRPIEGGCRQGPAPADAEALARTIQSDSDLVTSAPATVTVGGIEALRMDVTAAPGTSRLCKGYPAPQVVTPNDLFKNDSGQWQHHPRGVAVEPGSRMVLYLLDVPGGSSTRILAIAIVAPETRFDRVVDAAAPILDSIDFHAP